MVPAILLQLPAWGKLCRSCKQLAWRRCPCRPACRGHRPWILSSPPVSCLEGPGQASQQEAWLNPPSLQELHILILPWQRCERQSAKPSWGTEAQSQGPREELGKRLPVGLPSTQQASAQT